VGIKYYNDSSTPAREVTTTVTISTPGSTRTFITKLDNDNRVDLNIVELAKVVIGRISQGGRLKFDIIPMASE
jgi:hypothetical protein